MTSPNVTFVAGGLLLAFAAAPCSLNRSTRPQRRRPPL